MVFVVDERRMRALRGNPARRADDDEVCIEVCRVCRLIGGA